MNREMQRLLELLGRRPTPVVAVRAACDQILAGGRGTVLEAEMCKLALVVLVAISGPPDEMPWALISAQLTASCEELQADRIRMDSEMHATYGAAWDAFRGPIR